MNNMNEESALVTDGKEEYKNMKRRGHIWTIPIVCFCMMALPVSVFSQSGSFRYDVDCEPLADYSHVVTYFSASSHDVFEEQPSKHLRFRVKEFVYDKIGDEQFLRGFFFDNGDVKKTPIRSSVPKGRKKNKYWHEDGSRSMWFVRAKHWLCVTPKRKKGT